MLSPTRKRLKPIMENNDGDFKQHSNQDREAKPDPSMESASFHDIKQERSIGSHISIQPGGPFATANILVRGLYQFSCLCILPFYVLLDYLLSMFIHTTDDSYHSKPRSLFFHCAKIFLALIGLLIVIPLTVIAFVVWLFLQCCRPRSYAYISPDETRSRGSVKYERISTADAASPATTGEASSNSNSLAPRTYAIITANICLMPEFVAHINNLTNSFSRGKKIAAYLCCETFNSQQVKQQKSASSKLTETDFLVPSCSAESLTAEGYEKIVGDGVDAQSIASTQWSVTSKERVISDRLPGLADFLCLQEVFDSRSTDQLIQGLKQKYPYIIYDVSWPIHDYRMTLLGSGLCVASRRPFIDICFKAFPDGDRDDKLSCKGLLMTKVYLGKSLNGDNQVGYVATTHLQAWSRSSASAVRCKQLACIDKWLDEFVTTSKTLSGASEVTLFNLLTGDFNFDKASHFDLKEQSCCLSNKFLDPCIDENGSQHSWVIGTELKQEKLHDESVRTPQGLQRMLVSELERHQYVASTMPKKSSLQRVGDGKRRIDYILYKECNDVTMNVKDYKFLTGLATLSDHLPVGMTFSCEE